MSKTTEYVIDRMNYERELEAEHQLEMEKLKHTPWDSIASSAGDLQIKTWKTRSGISKKGIYFYDGSEWIHYDVYLENRLSAIESLIKNMK